MRARVLAPLAVSLALAVLMLGPALGRGVVIAYDMPWSPDARWTPFVLGQDTPAPRAVPSDALGVLLGKVVGAGLAQAFVLVALLLLAGTGAAALLRQLSHDSSVLAGVAAAVAGIWNPFVVERLTVGQWTVLLGYAVLPWTLRAALRARAGTSTSTVSALVAAAGCGGANSLAMVLPPAVVVLLAPRPAWRPLVTATATGMAVSGAWAVPGLVARVATGEEGANAFAPRADTPLGLIASVMSGGGFWNPAAWPPGRTTALTASVALALSVAAGLTAFHRTSRQAAGRSLALVALASLVVVLLPGLPGLASLWTRVVVALPGGGILRDSQKLLAGWVVFVAVGAGLVVQTVLRRQALRPLAVLVLLLPIVVLPTAAWGIGGRLAAVEVPEGYRAAAGIISRAPEGVVGVLPWRQYRRYDWNEDRISLTLVPRIVDQPTLYDDSLPLAEGRIPGEDPRAQQVTAAIEAGTDPVRALQAAGADYVAVEHGTGLAEPETPAGARLVAHSAELDVYALTPTPSGPARTRGVLVAGWALTSGTWLVHLLLWVRRRSARREVTR